ncbi:MAG: GreA/GreB family elongation factor [Candidatus Wildermuthbacteria bacterium]|nr:GreA/GreB family elongation factor [Candidatus Wildermuthbacteria bacterium]
MTEKYYLTKEGLEKVKKEYESLFEFKKMKTKGEVPAIWESEDVNPEYLAFQEDISLLETKLAEYENILKNFEIIQPPKAKEKRRQVGLGAKVVVQIDGNETDEFVIVGTLEANPSLGKISTESPVGKALFGRKVYEEVAVSSPRKTIYKIKKIVYGS